MGIACTIAIGCISGCGTGSKQKENSDGKVKISIGRWPEKGTEAYDSKMKQVEKFKEIYLDIEITGDTYTYAVNTFSAKASAGTLPKLFS